MNYEESIPWVVKHAFSFLRTFRCLFQETPSSATPIFSYGCPLSPPRICPFNLASSSFVSMSLITNMVVTTASSKSCYIHREMNFWILSCSSIARGNKCIRPSVCLSLFPTIAYHFNQTRLTMCINALISLYFMSDVQKHSCICRPHFGVVHHLRGILHQLCEAVHDESAPSFAHPSRSVACLGDHYRYLILLVPLSDILWRLCWMCCLCLFHPHLRFDHPVPLLWRSRTHHDLPGIGLCYLHIFCHCTQNSILRGSWFAILEYSCTGFLSIRLDVVCHRYIEQVFVAYLC